jgi:hypothetical protein
VFLHFAAASSCSELIFLNSISCYILWFFRQRRSVTTMKCTCGALSLRFRLSVRKGVLER